MLSRSAASVSPAAAPSGAGNVLFIVVDTLRADHLPAYGYGEIQTPNLDAFAGDAIRFDQAFANASWTRPSFASILSGRLPSSHGVMAKPDALADELTTMPEAFGAAGWETRGIATNYNVAPYFNFHQGFDRYEYLEPNFVLGADANVAVVSKGASSFARRKSSGTSCMPARIQNISAGGGKSASRTEKPAKPITLHLATSPVRSGAMVPLGRLTLWLRRV